jgi:hypothetical protein
MQLDLDSNCDDESTEPLVPTYPGLIAKDDDSQYVECLDCGDILEAGELNDSANFGESLSDA